MIKDEFSAVQKHPHGVAPGGKTLFTVKILQIAHKSLPFGGTGVTRKYVQIDPVKPLLIVVVTL
jgi:hypothetical protein